MKFINKSAILTLTSCLLVLAACGESTVAGTLVTGDGAGTNFGQNLDGKGDGAVSNKDSGGQNSTTDSDGVVTAPDGEAGSVGVLSFAMAKDDFGGICDTACGLILTQNAVRPIAVKYLVDGKPKADTLIQFALKDPNNKLVEVSTPNVPVDDKGVGQCDLKSGGDLGTVDVVASVPDDPAAGQLVFTLHVQSKAKGPPSITLHYTGNQALQDFGIIQVRLTKQEKPGTPACKDIDLGDKANLPSAAWQSPQLLKWDKPWSISYPQFPPWVQQQGGDVTFTVVGIAAKLQGSSPLAGGCLDTGFTVKYNATTKSIEGESVTVNVVDLPPRLKGVYDLMSTINLVSILPPAVANVLNDLFDILKDPVAGVLSLACKLTNGKLDSFCAFIFDDPKKPNINDLKQPFGGIIVKFLDAILLTFLPENIKTGLATSKDLANIFTDLHVGGTIEIKAEPDNAGFLDKAQTKDTWSTVTYQWTLGAACNKNDPNCGKKTFNIEAFQADAIVGHFDLWRDVLKSTVKIGQHALNVKWGALVNYIVQKQLLPAVTADPKNPGAPPIDSYEKLIKSLLGSKLCLVKDTCCEDFGKQLAGKQSIVGADFLAQTCEILVTLGTGYLEAQLTGLDAQSGDPASGKGLLLGTVDCPIFDADGDQFIDAIGASSQHCNWDMTLNLGGKTANIQSKFYALRQQ